MQNVFRQYERARQALRFLPAVLKMKAPTSRSAPKRATSKGASREPLRDVKTTLAPRLAPEVR